MSIIYRAVYNPCTPFDNFDVWDPNGRHESTFAAPPYPAFSYEPTEVEVKETPGELVFKPPRRAFCYEPTKMELKENPGAPVFKPPHRAFSYEPTVPLVSTKIDCKETPEAHVFKVNLHGLTKDEVKVELEEGNWIRITGEKIIEKVNKADHWYSLERSGGKFARSFRLPENAKAKNLEACMENGVLTITVPKKDMNKNRTSKIIHIGGR